MSKNDHAVSKGKISGDDHGSEMFLIYPHFPSIPAKKPSAMITGDRLLHSSKHHEEQLWKYDPPHSNDCWDTGICISQEREATTRLHLIHDLPYRDWLINPSFPRSPKRSFSSILSCCATISGKPALSKSR